MAVAEDDPRLTFIKLDEATIPPGGIIEHHKAKWWCVCPRRGLIFWRPDKKYSWPGAPQCNSNEEVTRRFRERMYPWAELRFLPSAFHRVDPKDYA